MTISSLFVERSFAILPPKFESAETYELTYQLGQMVSDPERVATWKSLIIPAYIYEKAASQLSELHGRAMIATEICYSALTIPALSQYTKSIPQLGVD